MVAIPSFTQAVNEPLFANLSSPVANRLETLVSRPEPVQEMLAQKNSLSGIPLQRFPQILHKYRDYAEWKTAARASSVDPELAYRTLTMAALQVAESVVGAGFVELQSEAGAELITALLQLATKEATVATEPTGERGDDGYAEAVGLAGSERAEALSTTRILAWHRGVEEGILKWSVEFPVEMVADQVAARLPDGAAEGLAEALAHAVGEALPRQLEARVLETTLNLAGRTYLGLLNSTPLVVQRTWAFFVGALHQPIGAVLVDHQGNLLANRVIDAEGHWDRTLERLLKSEAADAYILPTGAPDNTRLDGLRRLVPKVPVQVKPAGIKMARGLLAEEFNALQPVELAALVLARRAIRPQVEWAAIPPIELGLVEHQNALPEERMAQYLDDVRTVATLPAAPKEDVRFHRGQGGPSPARLNPFLKSLADVRPGMELDVVITSLTSFGAFASFGLRTDGLIHISEMADRRVESPAEVVQIGQTLKARVIEVDPRRRRIGLSLRAPRRESVREAATSKNRADALAKLNELFKD